MTKQMLIDATQPEETRVVVKSGSHIDDFDFEVANRKQLKGNIYLARVTRVEPSLQAAFIEYGGNRHGFLAFNEIHPDYYRIPVEDRAALIAEQTGGPEAINNEDFNLSLDHQEEDSQENGNERTETDFSLQNEDAGLSDLEQNPTTELNKDEDSTSDADLIELDKNIPLEGKNITKSDRRVGRTSNRRYKIQEVITRRQIMLVQVVKEERGNKGAALTTFLSLAGRYCVLMPNTPRGGGVSRKIVNAVDRKRLKQVVEGLAVQDGMAIIVRTAGSQRTKTEIKRDYEYLIRLWDQIRESTLISTAPCIVHEEANLIRRSIRDLYARDITEVLVEGDAGYKIAKSFMKTLMPSHARRVQPFSSGGVPIFSRFQVETQLGAIYEPTVELRSGGYIVIDQTEALVSIDVNSGRSTRERNIEGTAVKTNLEAAEEVARQLRLRDLAGLIVIDFIDMDETRNQHTVERKMKDVIKLDRARVQLGRISQFGLMELSRQRMRPSINDASTQPCPSCMGTGRIRSIDSAALQVLRNIEEEGLKQEASEIIVHLPAEIGFYILNKKRTVLVDIEQRYVLKIILEPDDNLIAPDYRIERTTAKPENERETFLEPTPTEELPPNEVKSVSPNENEEEPKSHKNRKRRRRSSNGRTEVPVDTLETDNNAAQTDARSQTETTTTNIADTETETAEDEDNLKRRRRRGKRGGRRRTKRIDTDENTGVTDLESNSDDPENSKTAVLLKEDSDAGKTSLSTRRKTRALKSTDKTHTEKAENLKPIKRKTSQKRSKQNNSQNSQSLTSPIDQKNEKRKELPVTDNSVVEQSVANQSSINPQDSIPDSHSTKIDEDVITIAGKADDVVEEQKIKETSPVTGPPRRGWWNKLLK